MKSPSCCSLSALRTWIKVIAVFDLVGWVLLLLIMTITLLLTARKWGPGEALELFVESTLGVQRYLQFNFYWKSWVCVFVHLVDALFSFRQLFRVELIKRYYQRWLLLHVVIMILYFWPQDKPLLSFSVYFYDRAVLNIIVGLAFIIKMLEGLVIYKYMRMLEAENDLSGAT